MKSLVLLDGKRVMSRTALQIVVCVKELLTARSTCTVFQVDYAFFEYHLMKFKMMNSDRIHLQRAFTRNKQIKSIDNNDG